jgi:tetratricopeptide (TPR) repeat protein
MPKKLWLWVFVISLTGCTTNSTTSTTKADPSREPVPAIDPAVQAERISLLLAQGDIAARDGKIDQAFFHYMTAEQLEKTDDRALVRAGNLHRTLGNREVAEKAWRLALSRNPNNGAVHESLGFLLLDTGRHAEALASFELAVQHAPESRRASIGMGLASEKRNDFSRSLSIYDDGLSREPGSVELRTYRARSLMNLGRFVEAKAAISEIVDEPMPVTWIVRGDLFAIDGDYAAALGAYLETLSEPWAYQRLGEHALRRKDYAVAMRYFAQAAERSPNFFEDANRSLAVAREHLRAQEQSR